MGPEGIILVNPPITTFQQSLTHSALSSTQESAISIFANLPKEGSFNSIDI